MCIIMRIRPRPSTYRIRNPKVMVTVIGCEKTTLNASCVTINSCLFGFCSALYSRMLIILPFFFTIGLFSSTIGQFGLFRRKYSKMRVFMQNLSNEELYCHFIATYCPRQQKGTLYCYPKQINRSSTWRRSPHNLRLLINATD